MNHALCLFILDMLYTTDYTRMFQIKNKKLKYLNLIRIWQNFIIIKYTDAIYRRNHLNH